MLNILILLYRYIQYYIFGYANVYSDYYSKTSGSLWQYCKDIPAIHNDGDIVIFDGNNDTDSLNFKSNITGTTNDDGDIEIMKYWNHGSIKILK